MVEDMYHTTHHPNAVGVPIARKSTVRKSLSVAGGRGTLISPLVRDLCSPLVRLADLISLTTALFLTMFSSFLEQGQTFNSFLSMRISMRSLGFELAFLLGWRAIFWATGLYQPRLNRAASAFLWRVPATVALCTGTLAILLLNAHLQFHSIARSGFVFWFTGTTLMLATRAAYYTYDEHIRPAFRKRRNVLVVGTGPRARIATLQLAEHPDFNYQLSGFVDSFPQPECSHLAEVLGGVDDLEAILMRQPIDEVLIALPIASSYKDIEKTVAICGRAGIQTQYSLEFFNTTEVAKAHIIDENTGARVVEMVHNDHRMLLKNCFDRTMAALGILLLSPLLLVVALLVKFTSKGPVFFVQQRFGKGKRTFGMIKFRSMVVDAEARQAELEHLNEHSGPTFKIKADPRITKIGAFLRKTSIDELPQLFNVLKGDMSLVGPRPLPIRDVERFSEPWLMRRFSVKPGITGLWQVSGRADNVDFDQTIKLDLRYIDRWSLILDIKILLRTFSAVFQGRGAF